MKTITLPEAESIASRVLSSPAAMSRLLDAVLDDLAPDGSPRGNWIDDTPDDLERYPVD